MSLYIRKDGIVLSNFTRAQVYSSMDALCKSFSFAYTVDEDNLSPILVGDQIEILADDIQIMTGYVEKLNGTISDDQHYITASGRSTMCDLLDSSVGDVKQFDGAVKLADIARSVLDGINLYDTEVVDNSGGAQFGSTDVTSADVGEGAFEFLESFARKKQVLVIEDGDGNLLLTKASDYILDVGLRNVISGSDNNIKESSYSLDISERYNTYKVQSQLNPLFLFSGTTPANISDQVNDVVDQAIRNSRIYEFNMEESGDSQTAGERAAWESNIRRARSMTYSATVQGHTTEIDGSNILWEPNKLINVQDQAWNISSLLLVRAVTYRYDLENGSESIIDMTYKDAYTLQASQDEREANTSEQGFNFIFSQT